MDQQGIYERIKGRVEKLKGESQDRFFTEYLVKLDSSLIQEKHRLDLMEIQLDKNCQIYRQRLASMDAAARSETSRTMPVTDTQETSQAAPTKGIQGTPQAVTMMGTQETPQAASMTGIQGTTQAATVMGTQETPQAAPMTGIQGTTQAATATDTQETTQAASMTGIQGTTQAATATDTQETTQTMSAMIIQETTQAATAMGTKETTQEMSAMNTQETTQAASKAMPTMGMQETPQAESRVGAQTAPQATVSQEMTQGAGQNRGTYSTGNISQQAPYSQMYMHPQAAMQSQSNAQPKKNHEFAFGINVFGTIGVLFVLAALILLGINYMGSLVKEMGLYVVGLLVWGVAEFVVKKKSQIMSMFFSSLGIGCLYVTTMVNFLYLHNFSGLVTILITTLITVVVMFVSRKKDAGILRIICIGACMISFLMMDTLHMVSDVELLIYMVMIVVVQLLGIFLSVKKWAYGIAIGQMAGTAIFAWIFAISTVPSSQVMELRALYVIGFVVVSILLMELTAWRMPAEDKGQMQGICITFGIGAFLLLLAYSHCADGVFSRHQGTYEDIKIWIQLGVTVAIAVMGVLFFFLTRKKGYLCWMQGYFVACSTLFLSGGGMLCETITVIVLLILYKLLAYRYKPLWAADAIITTWTALEALMYYDSVYGYVLLGALLLGILLMNHWQTYHEFILTGTAVLYISMALDNEQLMLPLIGQLTLPLTIAVMWLATLLFNGVKRFAGQGIMGFNVTILVLEALGYLGLISFYKYDGLVIYLVLTMLGLGIILFTFQSRFLPKAEGWRGLAVAIFLTYMVLVSIFRFKYRISASILLMTVGLFGIIFGFRQNDRRLRIYGLVLCMVTCFKITLFDFRVQSLQRIILFLAAGVMALLISGIYALMDKRYKKESENMQSNNTGQVSAMQEKDKMEMQGRE